MKKKLLLISKSSSTSVSLRSYLTGIFGQYLEIEACLAKDAGCGRMEQADLVLFASKGAETAMKGLLTPSVHWLTCSRTFNYTYLNRIFAIPSNSDVYFVSDTKTGAIKSIKLLDDLGITQYHFIPYYPKCQENHPSVAYAVTPGESRYVPNHVQTVIDVGTRIADISTISEIAVFFGIPMSLMDSVTKSFVSNFVQMLKLSNHQLSQATNAEFLMQSVIKNVNAGICILDETGRILTANHTFAETLEISKEHLAGTEISEIVPEVTLDFLRNRKPPRIAAVRGHTCCLLIFQEIEDMNHEKRFLIHVNRQVSTEQEQKEEKRAFYTLNDYRSSDPQLLAVVEAARRISLTDYRLLIQGEPGTGKEMLAQAIHNNSRYSQGPYCSLNLGRLSDKQVCLQLKGTPDGIPGILKRAEGGTLYLDGIQHLSKKAQRILLELLSNKRNVRLICSADGSLYKMCRDGTFRWDLFYAVHEVSLATIPLCRRPGDIPVLFDCFMENIFGGQFPEWDQICSEALKQWMLRYPWPGNAEELENLCRHFSCIRTGAKLTVKDLPFYIQEQMTEESLSSLDHHILDAIKRNPKIGRTRLCQLIQESETEVSEGKIRGNLYCLAERGLIKMNRTKGGCEITEKGEIFL